MGKSRADISIGDIVTLRKQHPCGSRAWIVRRVGADVGLECAGCGHRVMMTRSSFDKAYTGHESRQGGVPAGAPIAQPAVQKEDVVG